MNISCIRPSSVQSSWKKREKDGGMVQQKQQPSLGCDVSGANPFHLISRPRDAHPTGHGMAWHGIALCAWCGANQQTIGEGKALDGRSRAKDNCGTEDEGQRSETA